MKKMNEQKFINEVMKFNFNKTIRLTVHGKTNLYKPVLQNDDSWELYAIDNPRDISVYGLSCNGLGDMMGVLLSDYAQGITTAIKVEDIPKEIQKAPMVEERDGR